MCAVGWVRKDIICMLPRAVPGRTGLRTILCVVGPRGGLGAWAGMTSYKDAWRLCVWWGGQLG
jgi:hypothetical protein